MMLTDGFINDVFMFFFPRTNRRTGGHRRRRPHAQSGGGQPQPSPLPSAQAPLPAKEPLRPRPQPASQTIPAPRRTQGRTSRKIEDTAATFAAEEAFEVAQEVTAEKVTHPEEVKVAGQEEEVLEVILVQLGLVAIGYPARGLDGYIFFFSFPVSVPKLDLSSKYFTFCPPCN